MAEFTNASFGGLEQLAFDFAVLPGAKVGRLGRRGRRGGPSSKMS